MVISLDEIRKIKDIAKLKDKKNTNESWSLTNYNLKERRKWTHGYHHYPAKFIPQLVEKLIEEFGGGIKNLHINDPFFGSGTTIVTAISKGYKASGTDINKIAYLITKVKSTPISPDYLEERIEEFSNKISDKIFMKKIDPLVPLDQSERISYWFGEINKEKLGKIHRLITNEEDTNISDYFSVAFSHILKSCSFWLKSSTKPQKDLFKKPLDPYIMINKHLDYMKRGNKEFYYLVKEDVYNNLSNYLNIKNGDARNQPVENNIVDMVISSSPYVISYDYANLHQLSTIWLFKIDDSSQYRKQFIGTPLAIQNDYEEFNCINANNIINQLMQKDRSIANRISKYFIDMLNVFNECQRILKPGGLCCFVIGNTIRKGVLIKNAEVFIESLILSGFEIDYVIKRKISRKFLPQLRNINTGKFTNEKNNSRKIYPNEYIIIARKC